VRVRAASREKEGDEEGERGRAVMGPGALPSLRNERERRRERAPQLCNRCVIALK